MSWVLLSALGGLASNGFNITNRLALQNRGDATAYAWWFELVRTLFFLVILLRGPSFSLSSINSLPLIIVGFAELASVYVFMKMHAMTDLSLSSVISRMRIVWSPLIAWLFVGEYLTRTEYLGIITIFLGIAIVTSPKQIKKDKGIMVALLFSISSAILSTAIKYATPHATTELIVVSQGVIPLIALPFMMKNGLTRIAASGKVQAHKILLAGIFNIASSYLLVEALHTADASKAVGIYQAMTLFSVLYGICVLKEKERIYHKLLGSIIVIIGIILTIR